MELGEEGQEFTQSGEGLMNRHPVCSKKGGKLKRQESIDNADSQTRCRGTRLRQAKLNLPYCSVGKNGHLPKGRFSFPNTLNKDNSTKPNNYHVTQTISIQNLPPHQRHVDGHQCKDFPSLNMHVGVTKTEDSPEEDAMSLEGDTCDKHSEDVVAPPCDNIDDNKNGIGHVSGEEQTQTEQAYGTMDSQKSTGDSGFGSSFESTGDIETDTIYAQEPKQVKINSPADYPDNFPTCKRGGLSSIFTPLKPDQSDNLIVTHPYATDCELGDYFGATLDTYVGAEYSCHRISQVNPGSPADSMNIRIGDEIVLINDVFAPKKSHTDILNLFHRVKVDGQTVFELIIRRREKGKKGRKSWQWYKSTAILVPDTRKIPFARKQCFSAVDNNNVTITTCHKYRVISSSGLFLSIDKHKAGVKFLSDKDITTTITKESWIGQSLDDGYDYYCKLCSHDRKSYLSMDNSSKRVVVTNDGPRSFNWRMDKDRIYFKFDGEELFLAISGHDVTCSSECYMFLECPASVGYDQCDLAAAASSNESFDSGYATPTKPRQKTTPSALTRSASVGLSSEMLEMSLKH